LDKQVVPLGAHAHTPERLEILQVLVERTEQRFDPLFGERDFCHWCTTYIKNAVSAAPSECAARATASPRPSTARPSADPPRSGSWETRSPLECSARAPAASQCGRCRAPGRRVEERRD